MKVLIILLNRIGDTVQATPLFRAIKEEKHECHILVLDKFSAIAQCIPDLDRVWKLKGGVTVNSIVEELNVEHFDIVINLSPSIQAASIIALVKAGEKRGFSVSRKDGGRVTTAWTNYYLSVIECKHLNLFHIVDLFQKVAGFEARDLQSSPLIVPTEECPDFSNGKKIAIIHPGASGADRMVPLDEYAKLGKRLIHSQNKMVLIVGSQEESTITRELAFRVGEGCVDLGGRTTIPDLVAIIDKAVVVYGGDSAIIHIASMMGKEVVCFSIGSANYWCTGPYMAGNKVVQGAEIAQATPGRQVYYTIIGDRVPLTVDRFVGHLMRLVLNGIHDAMFLYKILKANYTFPPELLLYGDKAMTGFDLISQVFLQLESLCQNMSHATQAKDARSIPRIKASIDYQVKAISMLVSQYPETKLMSKAALMERNGIEGPDLFALNALHWKIYERARLQFSQIGNLGTATLQLIRGEG